MYKRQALEDAKTQEVACLFDLKVIPKTMTDGYESWWNVGLADVSEKESVRTAWELSLIHISGERKFDWAALTAKLEIEEKIGYWYAVGVIRPEKEVDRLKIAEYLHTVSERESIVYGYCEGHLVMLAYAQNKGEAEQILVRVSQKAAYMLSLIHIYGSGTMESESRCI